MDWQNNPRWKGITRPYKAEDVVRLRGTAAIEHPLARLDAVNLWSYLHKEPFVNAHVALTADQLASVKKCGHMGGKVLVPTREAVEKLVAARLAADVCGVPTLIVARTDAEAADLLTSDVDPNDSPFRTGERTVEGFYKTRNGL